MVRLIMGLKGTGKTKKLVDNVMTAVNSGTGDVVVIEKERKLTYDIPYQARLVEAGAYGTIGYDFIKGLLSGIHSGNYDVTHMFIDDFYDLVGNKDPYALADFVSWLNVFSVRENIDFYLSISGETESLPESLKTFIL